MNYSGPPAPRRLFCSRTLNLRSVQAVGFDMDYTLIHYHVQPWEHRAYTYTAARLRERGVDVAGLEFDPDLVRPGLVLDLELGNAVKANRFGFVKQACHGTRMLSFEEQRATYARELVDLTEPRWKFLDTLFTLSEASLFLQLVDRLDEGKLPGIHGYVDLYRAVRTSMDEAHTEGRLKQEIVQNPEAYVDLDPELPLALLDLKHAGKALLLITNSEWSYTQAMMQHAFDRFLPEGQGWRDLFDLVIVSAQKPAFWEGRSQAFEVVDDSGLLRPQVGPLKRGGAYLGGHAGRVEECLGLRGEEILYVGDHIYADVHVSKNLLRWRTALVLRTLEEELDALMTFQDRQRELSERMAEKEKLENRLSLARLSLQRLEKGYGPQPIEGAEALREEISQLRKQLLAEDPRIAELAREAGELGSERWGLLLRAGNDKSWLARSIERHADVYTSRVSNLLACTPFAYLRSPRGSMPHDHGPGGGV